LPRCGQSYAPRNFGGQAMLGLVSAHI
jgi:hypothetical protein